MSVNLGTIWAELGLRLDKFDSGLRSAKARLVQAERSFDGLGARMKAAEGASTALLGGIAALGAGIGLAGLAGIRAAAQLEQTEVAFTTLLGSAEAADKMIREIQKFAAETPFETPGLANAARMLVAFGVSAEETIPTLRRIGDVAAGIGAPIGEIAELYGKARVQGRLFAQDINQLTGRGIPIIGELAKQFGVAEMEIRELVENGEVHFEHLEEAFVSLTSEGGKFAGLMEAQSQTVMGLFSTLKDNAMLSLTAVGQILIETFDLREVISTLAAHLAKIQVFLEGLRDRIEEVGIRQVLDELIPEGLRGKIVIVAGAIVGALVPALYAFGAAAMAAVAKLLPFMIAGGALAALAFVIHRNWKPLSRFFVALWEVLRGAARTGVAAINIAFQIMVTDIARALNFVGGNLTTFLSRLLGVLAKIPGVGDKFRQAQQGIDSFRAGLDRMADRAETNLARASSAAQRSAGDTRKAFRTMREVSVEAGNGIGNTVEAVTRQIGGMFRRVAPDAAAAKPEVRRTGEDLGKAGTEGVERAGPAMAQAGRNLGRAAGAGIQEGVAEAARKAGEAFERARTAAVTSLNRLNDMVIAALRRRYDTQRQLSETALQRELDAIEKRKAAQLRAIDEVYDKTVAALDAETRGKIATVQAQIDSIDNQMDAEERAKRDKEELDRIAILHARAATEEEAEQKEVILADLNDAIANRNERLRREEMAAQRESLIRQIKAIRDAAETRKEQLERDLQAQKTAFVAEYEAAKENLELRKRDLAAFYSSKLEMSALRSEAEKIIIANNQQEIVALLKTYGDMYEDSGKTLGERFFTGFRSWTDQVVQVVAGIAQAASLAAQGVQPILTPAISGVPRARINQGAIDALVADIVRVEARRGDPATEQWFKQQYGGIEAYLTSQRTRLQQKTTALTSVATTTAPETAPSPAAYQGPLVTVQNMTVRSDADIEAISRQLHRHIQAGVGARGI